MYSPAFSRIAVAAVAFAAAIAGTGAVDCACPAPAVPNAAAPLGSSGDPAMQCAYPSGACTWSSTGELLNAQQDNCPGSIPAGSTTCPADLNGDPATLINHLYAFSCIYTLFINAPDFPSVKCDWDVLGNSLTHDQYGVCLDTAPCAA